MELIFAFCVGVLTSCGVYLALRGSTFSVVLGLTLVIDRCYQHPGYDE